MSNLFRQLLKKVGSGNHTGENLTRAEAATATKMMLLGEATPAQIGAFLIAHRIKRPTPEELAGMLDAYNELGPKLQPIAAERPVIVLGIPYDGRTRTAPISPIVALLLAAVGQPVIMHGGDRLPTKYGLPLVEIWQGLGVDWTNLPLAKTQQILEKTGIGFVYAPKHFQLNQSIWDYRDQLGKRPPLATMELIWCPYVGDVHMIPGFVHPPTEALFQETLALQNVTKYTLVKGLEGSCDLPRDRTAIIGLSSNTGVLERLHLAPRDYDFTTKNVPLETTAELLAQMQEVLAGKPTELMQTALWNGGFYLWRSGICSDMRSGIAKASELLTTGVVTAKLQELTQLVNSQEESTLKAT
ncbi:MULTISPECIES: anthranilate phosphoribosyltransferase family protein [unclassified Tolypothrix]|uniref:anthranilate phosphoribosyltransferase family protein n=1 Tax=unclassified Tolypothrix TaxID=2649714 RepID=UPI0005EABEA7|nr:MULTISPECIES: anthranilate phosphoribosyltransferase family protein [unclassified Tolypothrix]BAY88631.1 glycosyl transferase family protein [Microchaete diplosiphon NIES-3275]EKF00288.1 glycosyl transferase family, helical bundle domain protein [Tolypothrix sp. PCC 7601]MBE9086530.1 anthranilate phosphoribosyltransferase family protein [Tolypothrix sp. LEGE 11397]UYD29302.1 anthranilate phosphoribosyltransferase family protein [Tolypothrix sp. PCC 7712]UYD34790.1 anthranilate phosphoribosy